MLVLSRKPGERLLIGDSIWITIVHVGLNTVKVGIEAPRGVSIAREELVLVAPVDRLPQPAAALAAAEVRS